MAFKKPLQSLFAGACKARNLRRFSAAPEGSSASLQSSHRLIDLEYQCSAHNYHPIPIVFSKAKGSSIWDPEGNRYVDFLSAYSAANQGHCHPKIVKALVEQAEKLTLSSRAFYNDIFPVFANKLTSMLGYDMVLPMNTGAEGVETALKLARKWGYLKKGIPRDEDGEFGLSLHRSGGSICSGVVRRGVAQSGQRICFGLQLRLKLKFLTAVFYLNDLGMQAIIVSCCGCFHGRTLAAISMSCDSDATRGFGPLLPGHLKVDFGDITALEKIFKEKGDRIAGFLFEPIQGEAGVVIPPEGYLRDVRRLCDEYNILMIADEIQSGLGRSGRLLACDWDNIVPDVVILGKALGGGVLPVSAVLAHKDIMLCIQPGEHGSTFGGNPLASAIAIASLDVIIDEKLSQRSDELGKELRQQLAKVQQKFPELIKEVRGKGLFNAVELNSKALSPVTAYDICLKLKERGILAKPTHDSIIRLTPPLTISLDELQEGSKALHDVLEHDLSKMKKEKPNAPSHAASDACDRCGRNLYGSS
ncbi:ornithine aminotransferase mitochondrial [Phtheirospermum japonicum]|uniref:ornithine aminotransferase n=1 Tax=Phtheirospermum japonicum TaxID=374723 RepID=A0A830B7D0_9LAMI|nr:ornithine aminotransferase mitochondrial [Phtheirospermum japonicum]